MASAQAAEESPGHVVCYYPSWAHYRQGLAKYTVEDIPVELCTHLIYAFATMDSKTYLTKPFDEWLDIDLKNYAKFVQLKKKNPKMKVLLGVGGWNDSRTTKYSQMVADPIKRKTFVEGVVKFLLQHGFDGLDLDWEYPAYESKREDKEGFTKWVQELKTALKPHGLLLTSAVSASRSVIDRGYDVPAIAKHLDLINLMTYDFHGSWEQKVAHHSPLYPEPGQNKEFNADFAVNYWIKNGAPAHKIVLGVPFYGRSWTLAGSENFPGAAAYRAGEKSKYVGESGSMTYFEICLAHQKDGWAKVTGEGGPYLTKGDQWVGYDDIEAVTKKAEYARNKGLGGIMVWDTASDDFANACGHGKNPLLTAINRTLHDTPGTSIFNAPTPPSTRPSDRRSPQSNNIDRGNTSGHQQGGGSSSFTGNRNEIGGDFGTKRTSTFDSGSVQTSKLPYDWLAWPIFSKPSQDSQTTKSPVTTPRTTTYKPFSKPELNADKESNNSGTGPPQTSKPSYDWLSWPIFNKQSQDSQTTKSPVTTTRITTSIHSGISSGSKPFSKPGVTENKGSSDIKNGSSQTGKPSYDWVSWPIFNKSPADSENAVSFTTTPSTTTSIKLWTTSAPQSIPKPGITTNNKVGSTSQQSTKDPYKWVSWPVFSKSPENEQNQNSISSFNSRTPLSTTTPSPSIIPNRSSSRVSVTASTLKWFGNCQAQGFAPDPASCSTFYRCTDKYAYRFDCPSGLLWNQDASSCDWPKAVQCILPHTKPNVEAFHPPSLST